MTQSWKSWSWKLGLGIAVVTNAIASCGYYALAVPRPQSGEGVGNLLRITSLTSDIPASNIFVHVKETGDSSPLYTVNPGNPVPLNISKCSNDTSLTVQLFNQVNPKNFRLIDERKVSTIQATLSPSLLGFQDLTNATTFTLNYEIMPGGCQ
jgi:hypothetical protein